MTARHLIHKKKKTQDITKKYKGIVIVKRVISPLMSTHETYKKSIV